MVVELVNGQFGIVEGIHDLELEGTEVECWVCDGNNFTYQKEFVKRMM